MPDLEGRSWQDSFRDQREELSETKTKVTEIRHDLANHQQKVEYQFKLLDQSGEARHNKLAESFAELKNMLKWAGGLVVSIMLSFMAWALLQQYNSNETQKKDLQTQLNLLKSQEQERTQYRQEVLSRLPPGDAGSGERNEKN